MGYFKYAMMMNCRSILSFISNYDIFVFICSLSVEHRPQSSTSLGAYQTTTTSNSKSNKGTWRTTPAVLIQPWHNNVNNPVTSQRIRSLIRIDHRVLFQILLLLLVVVVVHINLVIISLVMYKLSELGSLVSSYLARHVAFIVSSTAKIVPLRN